MSAVSSKSVKIITSSPASQRLGEDSDAESDKRDFSTKSLSNGNSRKHLNEKEERFKNKYRWAEKQNKLRTGQCEGYSFFSIKAGLRVQDFRDTINWTPIRHAKPEPPRNHISDVVRQLLINAAPKHHQSTTGSGTTATIAEDEDGEDNEQPNAPTSDEVMNESDWRLGKAQRLDPLRNRGSNKLSIHMNLDSFIDSALSEQIKENPKADAPSDMSLTELQSPKLIESRFSWNKVRRALVTTAAVKPTIMKPVGESPSPPHGVITSENSFIDEVQGHMTSSVSGAFVAVDEPIGRHPPSASFMVEIGSIDSSGRYTGAVPEASRQARLKSNPPLPRPSTASSAAAKAKLAFSVPESAMVIRPRSAIVTPSKSSQSVVAPIDEFVQIVRQEAQRPKSSSGFSESSMKSTLPARPKTATLRIAPSLPISPQQAEDADIVKAMLALSGADDDQADGLAQTLEDKKFTSNYSGLIYHDPNRVRTWRGVSDLLSPPPLLSSHSHSPTTNPQDLHLKTARTDMRWAGKTLNSYRPWSPERRPPPKIAMAAINTNLSATQNASTPTSKVNTSRLPEIGSPIATGRSERAGDLSSPSRLARPASALSMTNTSILTDTEPESPKMARHASAPDMMNQRRSTSPAVQQHSHELGANIRPFSAQAGPGNAAITAASRARTHSADSEEPDSASVVRPRTAAGLTPGASAHTAPSGTGTPGTNQNSAFSSSHLHPSQTRSSVGKRPPLLINLITNEKKATPKKKKSVIAM